MALKGSVATKAVSVKRRSSTREFKAKQSFNTEEPALGRTDPMALGLQVLFNNQLPENAFRTASSDLANL